MRSNLFGVMPVEIPSLYVFIHILPHKSLPYVNIPVPALYSKLSVTVSFKQTTSFSSVHGTNSCTSVSLS